ncbi:MAG: hypothetical protein SGJ21_03550 [Alphaproteobacteria bacterium]|nr:hypothetical protein [Alphaproteobacteria bacterium]
MNSTTKRTLRSALVAGGLILLAPAAAFAGEWRLQPAQCPDLKEDRRDDRVTHGPGDRVESRRDERVVRCPASAWSYEKGPREGWFGKPKRPIDVIVRPGGHYFHRDHRGADVAVVIRP